MIKLATRLTFPALEMLLSSPDTSTYEFVMWPRIVCSFPDVSLSARQTGWQATVPVFQTAKSQGTLAQVE